MVPITGVWGATVLRSGRALPLDVEDFRAAINVNRSSTPIWEYFDEPCPEEDLLVVPSGWSSVRQRAFADLCQRDGEVIPAWKLANEWVALDAHRCGPQFVVVVEISALFTTATVVRHHRNEQVFTDMYPGVGYAVAQRLDQSGVESERLAGFSVAEEPLGGSVGVDVSSAEAVEWAHSVSSTLRLILGEVEGHCDVVVLSTGVGEEGDLCQLLCDVLLSHEVLAYLITLQDVQEVVVERQRIEEMTAQLEELQRKRLQREQRRMWPKVAAGIAAGIVVAAVVAASYVGHAQKGEVPRGELVAHDGGGLSPGSVREELTQRVEFPGGVLLLPPSWRLAPLDNATIDPTKGDEWRGVFMKHDVSAVRLLVVVKHDPNRRLPQELERALLDPKSGVQKWSPTFTPSGMPEKSVALSYREITSEISVADWIVVYRGERAFSLGCQYRLLEGMNARQAHGMCRTVVQGLRLFSKEMVPQGT